MIYSLIESCNKSENMNKYKLENYSRRYVDINKNKYKRFQIEIKPPFNNSEENKQAADPFVHGSYGSLLFDQRWKYKRQIILERDNNCCVICKQDKNLQVHHRQYHFNLLNGKFVAPWEYDNYLLITLCEPCHKRGHNKYKVPIINK